MAMQKNESGAISESKAKEKVNDENIGNISKRKRHELIGRIKEIRDFIAAAEQDDNTAKLLAYLSELEKDVNGKKYGLVFEEHCEKIDEVLEANTPVLTEDKELFINKGGEMNFLIEGDNLAALKLLEKTHKGKIDLIYIDPPYNTGKKSEDPNSGFMYDDKLVDENDSFHHSKWISFMNRRLQYAYSLLSPTGVCFINIDDNELAELRMLCDKIFSRENFIAILPRITKKSGKDHTDDIARNHDYVLIFVKKKDSAVFNGIATNIESYSLKDEFFFVRGGYKLNQTLDYDSLWYNEKMDFPLYIGENVFYPGGSYDAFCARHSGNHKPKDWVWRWSREKFEFGLANGFIVLKKGRNRNRIYTKTYANATITNKRPYKIEYKERETHLSSVALIDNCFSNDNAKKEITKIGLENFGFPKPTALIIQLIQIVASSKTILDFFAGSGTTGHAVMKLNAEDGGNRQFILCTNNENNICRDITYERIRRVIDKEGYNASLKYYRVDYVPISERVYYEYADELLKHVRELVELENGINFTGNDKIAIVLTEEELAEFVSNIDVFKKCKTLYMGHDLLPDTEQETALEDHNIKINIIPDYYYRNLQER